MAGEFDIHKYHGRDISMVWEDNESSVYRVLARGPIVGITQMNAISTSDGKDLFWINTAWRAEFGNDTWILGQSSPYIPSQEYPGVEFGCVHNFILEEAPEGKVLVRTIHGVDFIIHPEGDSLPIPQRVSF
jgi:hypothetical protein